MIESYFSRYYTWTMYSMLAYAALSVGVYLFDETLGRSLYYFIINLGIAASLSFCSYSITKNSGNYSNRTFLLCCNFFIIYNIVIWALGLMINEHSFQRIALFTRLPSFLIFYAICALQEKEILTGVLNVSLKVIVPVHVVILISYYLFEGSADFWQLFFLQVLFIVMPFVKSKINFKLIIAILLLVYIETDRRAFELLFGTSVILYLIYRYKILYNYWILISKCLLILPFALLLLNIIFDVNFFQIISERGNDVDTRTFLYVEVWQHIQKHSAYFWGTPGIGYESSLLDVTGTKEFMDTNFELLRYGRLNSEAGILNLLLHGGLINILAIFVMFWISVRNCSYSNNSYCKYIAMLLAFRFPFMFIDGPLTFFLQTFVLVIMFAICNNEELLSMTDEEVEDYFVLPKLSLKMDNYEN